jgi:hypothetical protein
MSIQAVVLNVWLCRQTAMQPGARCEAGSTRPTFAKSQHSIHAHADHWFNVQLALLMCLRQATTTNAPIAQWAKVNVCDLSEARVLLHASLVNSRAATFAGIDTW